MKEAILKTENLTKKYKDFTALDQASITVNKGDIYGLIGRNGAGKTTLMKVVTTLTNKSGGEFYLFGNKEEDLTKSKRRIGCLIENPAFFDNMTAYQNLKYRAELIGLKNSDVAIKEALDMLDFIKIKIFCPVKTTS